MLVHKGTVKHNWNRSYGFLGTTMRSTVEEAWAKRFHDLRLEWKYEPFGQTVPDFWLPKLNVYIEVKSDTQIFMPTLPVGYREFMDECVGRNASFVIVCGYPDQRAKTPKTAWKYGWVVSPDLSFDRRRDFTDFTQFLTTRGEQPGLLGYNEVDDAT